MSGTVGIVDATNIKISVGGDKIATITSGTMTLTAGVRDQTNNDGDGWESSDYGNLSATIDGDSFFAFDASYGFEDLFTSMTTKQKIAVEWNAGTTGDQKFSGSFVITNLSKTGSTGEDLKYSYSFKNAGPITKAAVTA